jgi:hypothetical protein
MAATKGNLVTASWADRSQSLVEGKDWSSIRFFIVKLDGGDFHNCSPFLIQKYIQSSIGRVKSVKKLRSGDLLVETDCVSHTLTLLDLKKLGHLSVTVTPHSTLNFSRGVISESDLLSVDEKEILENLESQQVCAVRRITIRKEGKVISTKHLILTFSTPILPTRITAGYLSCPVRPYIPNPLRCFQCQRFGHSKLSCRGTATCARCSEVGHDSEKCTRTPRCVNCKGDHPSFSRSCPNWIIEKEIQTVKIGKNISYPEARKLVHSRTPKPGVSYATATLPKPTKSVGTQTNPPTNTKNRASKATENETESKSKPKNKNTIDTATFNVEKQTEPTNNPCSSTKAQNQPLPKRHKKIPKPTVPPKQLTHKDFLKNRPISLQEDNVVDDSLKVYISPEEDMMTDGSRDSDADASNPTLC